MGTSNMARLILALLGTICLGGCAAYLGERIVRAPNLDHPTGMFDEKMDALWESHGAKHFLIERTQVTTPSDGVELHVAVMPTGDYPNRLDIERDGHSRSVTFQSALPVGPPRTPPKGTIIAIHGWQAEHRTLLYYAMELAREGWDVVLYDQRGHGRSGGEFVTFGARENQDLQAVIEWTRNREQFNSPLVLFGTSMGASIALLAAAESHPDAVIAVAPFARLDTMLPGALRHLAPFYIRPFLSTSRIEQALVHAQKISGVAISDMAPVDQAAEVNTPVLLIHSETDQLVPVSHAHQLYEKLPNATLILVDDRSHEALLIERDAVLDEALPWLARVIQQESGTPNRSLIIGTETSR